MPDFVSTLYSGKILEGDMTIYVGTAKQALPSDINSTADGTLTLSGFTQLDMKEEAIKPKFTQSFNPVMVRESRAPIWQYAEEEGISLGFALKRAELAIMARALASASITTVSPGAGQVGQTIMNFGDGPVNAYSILLHLLNKDDWYRLYHFPIMIPMDDVEQELDRGNAQVVPFNFAACADLTQPKGRRLCRVYDMTALKSS